VVIEEIATGRQITAGELFDAALARASASASAGVVPGDRVGLLVADPVAMIVWHLGVLALGAVSVPLDAHAPAPDTRARLEEATPALVVSEPRIDGPWRTLPVDASYGSHSIDAPAHEPSSPALMLFTSGTTGRPKGVPLSAANLVATAGSVVEAWGWTPEDRLIMALPLYHMHGLGVGVHGSLEAGARMLVLPRFDPAAVLAEAERASMLFGVPTMYHRLLARPEIGALGRLRLLVSGSAPLPEATFHQLESATGHQVLERYGMSETGMIASNPLCGERRPGTVGLPLPGMEIRLAGGQESEIEVRGPGVFRGYWHQPDADAEAFTRDRWFRTGDLGRYDEAGYLVICGRAKELIISGGHNVWPREVEEVIEAMPGVREAAVVGGADPEWGEVVVAHVVTESGEVTADAILDWCRVRLARYKVPRRVVFARELPRNHMGKLQRHQLT
jgi:malonyl-CoA/methylmalonyl-CoA synthetase